MRTDQGPDHIALCGDKPGSSREGKEGMGVPLGNILWQEAQGIKDLREEKTKGQYARVNTQRGMFITQKTQLRNWGYFVAFCLFMLYILRNLQGGA